MGGCLTAAQRPGVPHTHALVVCAYKRARASQPGLCSCRAAVLPFLPLQDVVTFLSWAAEPEMDERKLMGAKWIAVLSLVRPVMCVSVCV